VGLPRGVAEAALDLGDVKALEVERRRDQRVGERAGEAAERLEDDVGHRAVGDLPNPLDGVLGLLAVHHEGVVGAELARQRQQHAGRVDGDHARAAAMGGRWLFVLFFALNAALAVWAIRTALAGKRAADEMARPPS